MHDRTLKLAQARAAFLAHSHAARYSRRRASLATTAADWRAWDDAAWFHERKADEASARGLAFVLPPNG